MIQINDVNFGYKKDKRLFNNLTMHFKTGSIYGLLGKNGSGKTTLMKLISGLRYPTSGKISIYDINSVGRSPKYLSKLFLIPEEFDFPAISIGSFIKINSVFYQNFDQSEFYFYIKEFKVPKDEKITTLSLGQKKKFLLAFGLACNTDILLMDEPTNGLDIPSKSQFRKILAGLTNENRIFIISTHQIKDIEEIIDNVTIIDEGKMKFTANINELMDKIVFGNKLMLDIPDNSIIYEEKQFGENRIIGKNIDGIDTPVDLELLFNAVVEGNIKINELMDNTKIKDYARI